MESIFLNNQANSDTGQPLAAHEYRVQIQEPQATTQLKCPVCKGMTEHHWFHIVTYNKDGIHSRKTCFTCINCANNKITAIKEKD